MDQTGIVLISHSAKIVEGVKDLIRQVNSDVPIELAGGTDDGDIGTSIEKIQAAIENAHSPKGVLLIFDIGSAKMNAEMAVEMSEYDQVEIADVPIVEGAYVAAVESGMGKSVAEIMETLRKNF
ncbi:dihydroxyacetone kinase phosphoryl donor subunit DhaM [Sediminibacillus halophilus]|uniref:phosphoenolpyruvate--glycerone phosphotransferase n=1 Tax=Sediminibacillus halophilus TaxID=482461 RepID=A0A1G9RKX9_9BACI|nr:dihydroxyacetone kinase phosphoryl donor subunit DhaM [Sediminibacillus halophilus]SDM23979.1 dihydroxyacetone kinase, phosphotransfer subunit [Sediminibacillus halophilus]